MKIIKYLKRVALIITAFIFLVVITAVIIVYFYEDSIKKLIINQINKQLASEIQVKEFELSLFDKFPNVSLTFTDVIAKDAINTANKGILLKAENVYLQFNIWDIYYKKYIIKQIEAKNGFINLLIYKDESVNYHFWKSDTSAYNDSFSFDLQKLVFKNMSIRYKDFCSNQDYSGIAKNVTIKGKFNNDKYFMYANGHLLVNYLNVFGINYFPLKNAYIDMILNVDNNTFTYSFREGGINIGNLKFDITGDVIYSEIKKYINLAVKGSDLKLQYFIKELPAEYKKYFDDYIGKGQFYFQAGIKGFISGTNIPSVNVNFGIKDGQFTHKKSDILLENVSFTGKFTNGNKNSASTSLLSISNFNSKLKSGILKADFTINNFNQPEFQIVLDTKMNLEDVQNFFKFKNISSVSGNVEMKVSFNSQFNFNEEILPINFIESKTSGYLKLTNVNLTFINDSRKYDNINGDFKFSNNDMIIDNLSLKVFNNDFLFKGYFKNLLSYIFLENQKLFIDADLTSVNIDLDELIRNNTTSSDTSYKLTFSDMLDFKMNVNIGKLTFNKFSAANISGKIRLKNMQLLAKPLSFNCMDGKIDGLVMLDGSSKNKLLISSDANITDVNIKKLFYEFNNFGQNNIKAQNLEGIVTANVKFAGVWNSNLEPDIDKIYAKADIKIEKGELLDYEPMMGLSRFLKVKDLENVKFSTLQNQIEIKNRKIYIPLMDIKSSAIDIKASGEHTFDNEINYRIRLRLSDLLAQKAKKAKPENEEFSVIEDDGFGKTSLYILITGTVDKPVYKYDAKGVKEKIVVSFIKEKQTLKTILNEEFGWFKKDTAIQKQNKEKQQKEKIKPVNKEKSNLEKQEEGKFIIEWDENENQNKQ